MLLYGREDLAVWKLMCSFAAVEQWRLATLHIEIKHESVSTDSKTNEQPSLFLQLSAIDVSISGFGNKRPS